MYLPRKEISASRSEGFIVFDGGVRSFGNYFFCSVPGRR
jgi:predicted Rossmann-fold nucleotide-binding protein